MCVVVWEICPSGECRGSEPLKFQSINCPRYGCPTKVEKYLPAARSRWAVFSCNTEDCNFSTEHSSKLEAEYRSFGNLVPHFGSDLAAPLSIGPIPTLSNQQPLPNSFPPVTTHPENLADDSQPLSSDDGEVPAGQMDAVPARRQPPRWAQERLAMGDARRPRKERKTITFKQPSHGDRVKTQFRSLGTVRLDELEPEVVDAIRAKKQAMDEVVRSRAPHVKEGVQPRYSLEEDELLQMLRLNCFSYKQIYTDFMKHRTVSAITHRRNNQWKKSAEGFVYIPDDAAMNDCAAEAGPSGTTGDEMDVDSTGSAGPDQQAANADDEMDVDLVSTSAEDQAAAPASDEMVVDNPEAANMTTGTPKVPPNQSAEDIQVSETHDQADEAAGTATAEKADQPEAPQAQPTADSGPSSRISPDRRVSSDPSTREDGPMRPYCTITSVKYQQDSRIIF